MTAAKKKSNDLHVSLMDEMLSGELYRLDLSANWFMRGSVPRNTIKAMQRKGWIEYKLNSDYFFRPTELGRSFASPEYVKLTGPAAHVTTEGEKAEAARIIAAAIDSVQADAPEVDVLPLIPTHDPLADVTRVELNGFGFTLRYGAYYRHISAEKAAGSYNAVIKALGEQGWVAEKRISGETWHTRPQPAAPSEPSASEPAANGEFRKGDKVVYEGEVFTIVLGPGNFGNVGIEREGRRVPTKVDQLTPYTRDNELEDLKAENARLVAELAAANEKAERPRLSDTFTPESMHKHNGDLQRRIGRIEDAVDNFIDNLLGTRIYDTELRDKCEALREAIRRQTADKEQS